MEELMQRFQFDVKVNGVSPAEYIAKRLEENEKQELELDRAKADIGYLKQLNNINRSLLDAAKYGLKEMEFKMKYMQEQSDKS